MEQCAYLTVDCVYYEASRCVFSSVKLLCLITHTEVGPTDREIIRVQLNKHGSDPVISKS